MRVRSSILLTFGFTALLLLVGVSAFLSWSTAIRGQEAIQTLHQTHLQAGQALADLRSNVYLSAVLIRDYLIDPAPHAAEEYEAQFREIREETARSFAVLHALELDEHQRQALAQLRTQLDAYWDPTEIALDWTPEERASRRVSLLRQKVRKRNEIFTLSRDLERLLSANLQRERSRVSETEEHYRRLLEVSTATTVLAGIVIALFTVLRVVRLERASESAAENLRHLSSELRSAQESDRKYLSRELHDQIGQMLTGLKMELTTLYRRRPMKEPEVVAGIDRAKATVEHILRSVRDIAMLLRPSMLDDLGLAPALKWHVKEFSRISGIQGNCDIDETVENLPETHSTCLYRVVQEALTNAARHSQAKNVSVTVRCRTDAVHAAIIDDGRGFDPRVRAPAGLGLLGMTERVRELGGQLAVTSQPGRGTHIEVILPFEAGQSGSNAENSHRGRSRNSAHGLTTPA